MKKVQFLTYIVAGFLLVGCSAIFTSSPPPTVKPTVTVTPSTQPTPEYIPCETVTVVSTPKTTPTVTPSAQETVMQLAQQAVEALRDRDMERLAEMVHPTKGVRFSPYAWVSDEDLVFFPNQLPGAFADPTVYHWGVFDGSGEPIEMTFAAYYERFVYDQDFANAEQVGYNQRIGTGNTVDNSLAYYPGASVVEFHFSGFDPAYGGMDWRSLRLVFQREGDRWYLVGIIHDEWTI